MLGEYVMLLSFLRKAPGTLLLYEHQNRTSAMSTIESPHFCVMVLPNNEGIAKRAGI